MKRLALGLLLMGLLGACVRPYEPAPTATPQGALIPVQVTPTQPPIVAEGNPDATGGQLPTDTPISGFPPQAITAWLLQNLGISAGNLAAFDQFVMGPDDMIGYTFQDANAQNCVGFIQASLSMGIIWNGDVRCGAPGQVIGGSLIFALTTGEPFVATYAYIDPNAVANAGGVSLSYPNGDTSEKNLTNNAFLILRQGLDIPVQLHVIDEFGFTASTFNMPN